MGGHPRLLPLRGLRGCCREGAMPPLPRDRPRRPGFLLFSPFFPFFSPPPPPFYRLFFIPHLARSFFSFLSPRSSSHSAAHPLRAAPDPNPALFNPPKKPTPGDDIAGGVPIGYRRGAKMMLIPQISSIPEMWFILGYPIPHRTPSRALYLHINPPPAPPQNRKKKIPSDAKFPMLPVHPADGTRFLSAPGNRAGKAFKQKSTLFPPSGATIQPPNTLRVGFPAGNFPPKVQKAIFASPHPRKKKINIYI